MNVFQGLISKVTASATPLSAHRMPDVPTVSQAGRPVPDFDEFGAPEGAFGRFQTIPAGEAGLLDEHAELASDGVARMST